MAKKWQVITSGINATVIGEFHGMVSVVAFLGRLSVDSDLGEVFVRTSLNGVQNVVDGIAFLEAFADEFVHHCLTE